MSASVAIRLAVETQDRNRWDSKCRENVSRMTITPSLWISASHLAVPQPCYVSSRICRWVCPECAISYSPLGHPRSDPGKEQKITHSEYKIWVGILVTGLSFSRKTHCHLLPTSQARVSAHGFIALKPCAETLACEDVFYMYIIMQGRLKFWLSISIQQ